MKNIKLSGVVFHSKDEIVKVINALDKYDREEDTLRLLHTFEEALDSMEDVNISRPETIIKDENIASMHPNGNHGS